LFFSQILYFQSGSRTRSGEKRKYIFFLLCKKQKQMENIFTIENVTDFSEKINIDDLYEKKKQYDLNKLALYNKILNRIHQRIKLTARQKIDSQFCWYVVPETMIGIPKYDQGACIAYLLDKLKENGFLVRYIHPNTLFICWNHWVPSYVRNELKKKTGIIVDEYGNKIETQDSSLVLNHSSNHSSREQDNQDNGFFRSKNIAKENNNPLGKDTKTISKGKQPKNYTPIHSYKPKGIVYDDDFFQT